MLSIKQAYLQIGLDEESMMIQAISTTNGMYHVNRLMFGITMTPALLEDKTKKILTGIELVRMYYDFIIVDGKDLKQNCNRIKNTERIQYHTRS